MKLITPRKAFGTLFGALALIVLAAGGSAPRLTASIINERSSQVRLAGGDGQETHGGKGGKGRFMLLAGGDGQETHGGKGGKGRVA